MRFKCTVFLLLQIKNVLCYNVPFFLSSNMCLSNDCQETDVIQTELLNTSRNACNDFYGYVCDKWKLENHKPNSEPFWSQYTIVNQRITSRLQNILEESADSNAKQFYNECINSTDMNYSKQMRYVIDAFGGWSDINVRDYSFLKHIVEVTKLLNIHPILKFHVNTDYTNTKSSSLYIEPGTFIFPEAILMEPRKHERFLNVYEDWITKSVEHIYKDIPSMNSKKFVKDVVNFETELVHLGIGKDRGKKITVHELSEHLQFDCVAILKFLFEDTGVEFESVTHVISHPQYLTKMRGLIEKTSPQTVSNYVIWSAIKDLSRHTSSALRQLSFEVDRAVLGVASDLPREQECVENTLKFFADQLVMPYFNAHMEPTTIARAHKIAHQIKYEFLKQIKSNQWLSEEGRQLIFNKVANVRFELGFSKKGEHDFLKMQLPTDYFIATLKLKNIQSQLKLHQLKNTEYKISWPSHAFEVNAYYNVLQNIIILPLGILHPPFFHVNYPEARNYGALGTLIGHELSHSVDMSNGILTLMRNDLSNYKLRKDCIKSHYNSLGVSDGYSIGENIADTVGLQLSYAAMVSGKKISDMSHRSLFFISFGQMWCEVNGDSSLIQDEHAPVRLRVSGALQNSKEFNYVYACKEIKQDICQFW